MTYLHIPFAKTSHGPTQMQGSLGNVVLDEQPLLSMVWVWGPNFAGQLTLTATGTFIHLVFIPIIHSFTFFQKRNLRLRRVK